MSTTETTTLRSRVTPAEKVKDETAKHLSEGITISGFRLKGEHMSVSLEFALIVE